MREQEGRKDEQGRRKKRKSGCQFARERGGKATAKTRTSAIARETGTGKVSKGNGCRGNWRSVRKRVWKQAVTGDRWEEQIEMESMTNCYNPASHPHGGHRCATVSGRADEAACAAARLLT
eukprot:5253239-Pleurochrysis_carterae.AAC.2